MRTVAIICEYNPFHRGHQLQIEAVREMYRGEELCIIALMSGGYVQRGGMAVLPRADRAMLALEYGVDLVLELPYPWCMSGADYFAGGAVSILEKLGGVDALCFGSECGDIERLKLEANRLKSHEYLSALDRASTESPSLSWAAVREAAYRTVYGEELPRYSPNDLLGIAYLSHMETIKPLAISRKEGYSASAARKSLEEGDLSSLAELVPEHTLEALKANMRAQSRSAVDAALLSSLRLMPQPMLASCAEGTAELAGLITRKVEKCTTVEELVKACTVKKYTSARVRRALWHAFLRTPADLPSEMPAYTRLLACNQVGLTWLAGQRKISTIPVVTRVSNVRGNREAELQFFYNEKLHRLRAFLTEQDEKNLPIIKSFTNCP